jgi:ABC-2 type transport system permease protein
VPFLTIFRYALRGRLTQIIGWGASLLFLAAYLVVLHDAFVSQQEQFNSLVAAYPPELMAAFGGVDDLFIPTGFLNFTYFSYVAVILGFMAVASGSGLLAADEERGLLDLQVSYPVSRLVLFSARLLALGCSMALILLLSWLGFVLTSPGTGLKEVSAWEYALPHLELLVFMLFFAGLALLLSQVLPSRSAATAIAAALLLGSYLMKVLVELDDNLVDLERLSPLHYIQGGYAIDGLNVSWLLGLLVLGLVFVTLAAWRFEHRDLRISGEGSWPAWMQIGKRKNPGTERS